MRLLLSLFIAAAILISCSGTKLYSQGMNKISKAIQKDSSLSIPTDTLRVVEHDTILGVDGKDSIIIQKETIKLPCNFDVEAFMALAEEKSGRQLRFERRASKDSTKHLEKMYKLETDRLEDSLSYQKKLNRQLTKQIKSSNNKEVKIAKEDTKQKKGGWFTRILGRYWWVVAILSFILGLYVKSIIPRISNPFKNIGNGTQQ